MPRHLRLAAAFAASLLAPGTIRPAWAAPADDPAALIDAVRAGDRTLVATLLSKPVDVNATHPDGTTALHWAAYLDAPAIATLLIRAGARVDAATDRGVTPLQLACGHSASSVPATLLEAGADPNRASAVGEAALMACARAGNAGAVTALLGARAAVDAAEKWQGQTALMAAVASGHDAVTRVLVSHGANVNAKSATGSTPMMFAARGGHVGLGEVLRAAGADVNAEARDGSSALLVALVRGHLDFATWLLDRGANPNAAGTGYTPLHWVAGSWHSELTGPNGIQAERDEQWAVLGGVPRAHKVRVAEALLAKGADPNARLSRNPPQFGYTSARFKIDMSGATPFMLAAMDGHPELMKLLVARGADPQLATNQKTTALMVAAGLGRVPAESLVTEPQTLAAVQLALELGADVKAANAEGSTALHGAAHIRLDPLVQLLVDRGADVNARNKRGLTPLMVAEGSGHSDNPGLVGGPTAVLLRKLGAQ